MQAETRSLHCTGDSSDDDGDAGDGGDERVNYEDFARPFSLVAVGDATLRLRQNFVGVEGTGGCVWPVARHLCSLMAGAAATPAPRGCPSPRGAVVLELGCGLGPVSLACAALGAEEVLATDNDADALSLARANLSANSGVLPRGGAAVRFAALEWGPRAAEEVRPLLATPPDLLVGCDIVYDPRAYAALRATLVAVCEAWPRCEVLLAMQRRFRDEEDALVEGVRDALDGAELREVGADGTGTFTVLVLSRHGGGGGGGGGGAGTTR